MSVQGDSSTSAAGMGQPASRMPSAVDSVSPPPAESPAMMICEGSMPQSSISL